MDLNDVPNQPCGEVIASNVFQAVLFRIENQAWVYTRRGRKPVGLGSSNKIPHTGASPNRNKIESACTCEENSALLHVLARTCRKNPCRWGEGHERRRKTRRLATGKRGGWCRKTRRLAAAAARAASRRSSTSNDPSSPPLCLAFRSVMKVTDYVHYTLLHLVKLRLACFHPVSGLF